MDWKVFGATFAAVLLAELADKTQMVGMGMASKSGRPFTVWMGSVAAYMIVTAATVLVGALASKFIRPDVVKTAGAVIFVLIGIFMFFDKI
jgi:putative Ca2+/H+ antiporter (TMEM165/GDT1 family)